MEISDCKVVIGESLARQYRMVVCRMILVVRMMKRTKAEQKTKRWKLKEDVICGYQGGVDIGCGWSREVTR